MAKINKSELPPVEAVPSAKKYAERVEALTSKVAAIKEAASKDGAFNKYDDKYRQANKRKKRAQRRLLKALIVGKRYYKAPEEAPAEEAPAEEASA